MKPRTYLEKFGKKLDSGKEFELVKDALLEDFTSLLTANSGHSSLASFNRCEDMLLQKWHQIGAKRGRAMPDRKWAEIASAIDEHRLELFAEDINRKDEQ